MCAFLKLLSVYTLSTFENARFLARNNIYLANSQINLVWFFEIWRGYIFNPKLIFPLLSFFSTIYSYNHQINDLHVQNLHTDFFIQSLLCSLSLLADTQ